MQKRKKLWAVLLCVALLFTCVFPAGAAEPEQWSETEGIQPRALNPFGLLGWRYPLESMSYTHISSGYKLSYRPSHVAIDIIGANADINGVMTRATCDGTIIKNGVYGNHGNYVAIETNADDPGAGPYVSRRMRYSYSHLQSTAPWSIGYGILKGTTLAKVGSTGNSTGPHLHFAVWRNTRLTYEAFEDNSINPQMFFPNVNFTGYTSSVMY